MHRSFEAVFALSLVRVNCKAGKIYIFRVYGFFWPCVSFHFLSTSLLYFCLILCQILYIFESLPVYKIVHLIVFCSFCGTPCIADYVTNRICIEIVKVEIIKDIMSHIYVSACSM